MSMSAYIPTVLLGEAEPAAELIDDSLCLPNALPIYTHTFTSYIIISAYANILIILYYTVINHCCNVPMKYAPTSAKTIDVQVHHVTIDPAVQLSTFNHL